MLEEYIKALKEAIKSQDERKKRQILNALYKLGMDTATALYLASK